MRKPALGLPQPRKLTIRNVQCRFKTEAKLNVHWLRPHGHLQETYPHSNSLGLSKRRLQRYSKIFNKIHFANFALWFWDGHLKRFCPPLGALGEGRRDRSLPAGGMKNCLTFQTNFDSSSFSTRGKRLMQPGLVGGFLGVRWIFHPGKGPFTFFLAGKLEGDSSKFIPADDMQRHRIARL
jgi:hypothetical protein